MTDPVFLSDAELAERLNIGEKTLRIAVQQRGFPPKRKIWGGKRYWPAVRAFLDRTNGVAVESAAAAIDGEENWDDDIAHRRRTRAEAARA